ncbi:hypothetical protein GQ53DRAFT_747302 [Thozetella sp. PMI_491]|nr:hypothetical protein GQ53DRAFT_747302 [Thozetella sp. PMI_491]
MKFSVAAIVGVLATIVNAKAVITNSAFDVVAGKPFTLTWVNATGAVTIQLVQGDPNNLKPVGSPLATGATGGTASVTVPSSTPSGEYAFEVIDETKDPNYSVKFEFQGSASAVSSTTSASSTTSSASSTSSAASSTVTSAVSSSASSNSTTSTTSSKASSTSAKASTTTSPTNTNNGQRFASPLALVLVTVAALVCFN